MKTSIYTVSIKNRLAEIGQIAVYDARHIEAYMRLNHSTLDHLSKKQFNNAIDLAIADINVDGRKMAEQLAISYNL